MHFSRYVAVYVVLILPTNWDGLALAQSQPSSAPKRLTIISDAFSKTDHFRKDWGFAALVEYGGKRVLFDCGNDADNFTANVKLLKIDLTTIDAVVISHRHGDHTAGLSHVLKQQPGVPVYTPFDEPFSTATPKDFYLPGVTTLPKHMRYFDGDEPAVAPHGIAWPKAKINRIKERVEILPAIHLVPTVSQRRGTLEMPELSLAVATPEGLAIVTGCGHCGIEAVLEAATAIDRQVRLLAGGFHLVTTGESEIERVSASLRERWMVGTVAPGHCTSEFGFVTLQRHFGTHYLYAGVGEAIPLP
jgi:7,8-dihydropterin-6-yl-methyl-4-(beta-D-ribofuranosyl)aminobenzene 5'-phosphate synthase